MTCADIVQIASMFVFFAIACWVFIELNNTLLIIAESLDKIKFEITETEYYRREVLKLRLEKLLTKNIKPELWKSESIR